jgi:hypothetical protein
MFTDSLPSNVHRILARVLLRRNVFTESLPSIGSIHHNINGSVDFLHHLVFWTGNHYVLKITCFYPYVKSVTYSVRVCKSQLVLNKVEVMPKRMLKLYFGSRFFFFFSLLCRVGNKPAQCHFHVRAKPLSSLCTLLLVPGNCSRAEM